MRVTVVPADPWEYVCPVVEWQPVSSGYRQRHLFPERIQDADLVIVQRDFPCGAEYMQAAVTQTWRAAAVLGTRN